MPDDDASRRLFAIFNEIAIVGQLSRAIFEARLPRGVLVAHFSLLNHLVRVRDGQTPLRLSRAFQVPKTTMTHTISGAVKHGWVELRRNEADGRSKRVWITEAGRAFREEAIASLAPDLRNVAEALPRAAQDELLDRLVELRSFLDAQRDGPNGSDG